MSLRVREFPERGVLVWFAVIAGIAAWVFHLVLFAGLVRFVHDNGFFWLFYVGDAIAIVITLVAGWLSWLLVQSSDESEDAGTPGGRRRFLGLLGLIANGINLLLILFEGSYVFFLSTGHA
jgi:hypothetical protein